MMAEREWLDDQFERHRPQLRSVAYRMLGSVDDADDALQESWLRIRDQDPQGVE
jgi:DNA-directed RNA polymerase specialized sigma24 family protein